MVTNCWVIRNSFGFPVEIKIIRDVSLIGTTIPEKDVFVFDLEERQAKTRKRCSRRSPVAIPLSKSKSI